MENDPSLDVSSRLDPCLNDEERKACLEVNPAGFHLRPPPPAHDLRDFLTPDAQLFQTIHMGPAVVDPQAWRLTVDGRVRRPFALTLGMLRALPAATVTSFHECYGSPLKPPVEALWRVGNVAWTGVRLRTLLGLARPEAPPEQEEAGEELFVHSDGLDHGAFAGVTADRYRKDLPLAKAMRPEVLVAYEINGRPLDKWRGGPVRLVVPGWFGTNSTKWLCRLSVQPRRAAGPFTTTFYNEPIPGDGGGGTRPVWRVEPNSIIVSPAPGAEVAGTEVTVWGWSWGDEEIAAVDVSSDGGRSWVATSVKRRRDYEWQRFEVSLTLKEGLNVVTARATSGSGKQQPLSGRRNHVHSVEFRVL